MEVDTLSLILLGAIGAVTLVSIKANQAPDVHPLLLNHQSDVSRIRNQGESAVYRAKSHPNGSPLLLSSDRSIRTLYDVMQEGGLKVSRGNPFLGTRGKGEDFVWHTYADIESRVTNFGSGLMVAPGISLKDKSHRLVGIWTRHTVDTAVTSFACHQYSLTTVPLDVHVPTAALSSIVGQTQLKVLVVDSVTFSKLIRIAEALAQAGLEHVIVTGDLFDGEKALLDGLKVWRFDEIMDIGRDNVQEAIPPAPEDIASIFFTSTLHKNSSSRGVTVSHKNMVSAITAMLNSLPPAQKLKFNDRAMSYLSLGYIMEHLIIGCLTLVGGSIAFTSGDADNVLEDAQKAKPTIFAGVPKYFYRLREDIQKTHGRSFLWNRGMARKEKLLLHDGRCVNNDLYDSLVFRDVREKVFGGKVKLILSVADNSDPSLATFFRAVMGAQFIQGVGLTETTGPILATHLYDYSSPGTAGAPLAHNEVKLVDVPGQYTAEDTPNPRGELHVRGANVFSGYLGDAKATKEAVDQDGWLKTGIVAEVFPNGTFRVIERV